MVNWIKKHKELLIFLLYACVTFSLLFYHENWRDEAQAWLLARDCTIPELINAMKYEGHFLLWYLILMPFAKAGFPYFTTNIISWLITCIAVWLIVRKAPFDFDKRVLLIFTFPLLYLFPVVSRCYCLIPLAIVLMSIFYKGRKEKPLRYLLSIVLLLNTHVIMAGMVAVVFIDYIIELYKRWRDLTEQEKQKTIVCIIITVVLMLASIYPILGSLNTNKEIHFSGRFSLQFTDVLFHYPLLLLKDLFFLLGLNDLLFEVILVMTIITVLLELKTNLTCFVKIWMCVLWQCIICASIVGSTMQRTSTIILIILYFKWINEFKSYSLNNSANTIQDSLKRVCLVFLVMLNILGGLFFIKNYEIPQNNSNAFEMARYINENLEENSIVLSGSHVEYVSSIIPYVRKNIGFYHVSGKRYFSYAIWDNINKIDICVQDFINISKMFSRKEKVYYVFCPGKYLYDDKIKEATFVDKLLEKRIIKNLYHTNDNSLLFEDYIMYEVNLDQIRNIEQSWKK